MLYIFDNQCSPKFVAALCLLEEFNSSSPLQCEVRHIREYIPANASDEDVIKTAGKNNATVVTYDRDLKQLKQYGHIYKEYKTGVIYFRSSRQFGLRYWDIVVSFIKHWEELKKKVSEIHRPFAIEVTLQGLSVKEF